MDAFVYALLEIANEEGNTVTLETLRNKALEKMLAGGGVVKTLISSSLNGKTYSYNLSKPSDVLFTQSSQAIRLYNKGIITNTTFDWQWV